MQVAMSPSAKKALSIGAIFLLACFAYLTPKPPNAALRPQHPTASDAPTLVLPVHNPVLPVQTRESRNEIATAQRSWPEWTFARTALLALPPEAQEVFQVLAKGGPFRYSRDGIEFQNRERRLPAKPRGYYREYTVPTPAERDRGARRIIAGQAGEKFYTDDHYDSFRLIE
jgi:guanyl-specific ribonuclease Sa